jgi:hypothetical protein
VHAGGHDAACNREVVAREIRTTKGSSRGSDNEGRYGDFALRGRVGFRSDGINKSQDWLGKVYKPDVKNKWDKLYKKPGCNENDL